MQFDPAEAFAHFEVEVGEIADLGVHAIGHRRFVPLTGGRVSGTIGNGVILAGGTDWQWLHADGTVSLDAHYALLLDSGEHVEVESRGLRHVDANGVTYFRTAIRLTTTANRPDINHRLFISTGTREDRRVLLDLYPVP